MDLEHGTAAGVFDHRWTSHLHHVVDNSNVGFWEEVPLADGAGAVLQGHAGSLSVDIDSDARIVSKFWGAVNRVIQVRMNDMVFCNDS